MRDIFAPFADADDITTRTNRKEDRRDAWRHGNDSRTIRLSVAQHCVVDSTRGQTGSEYETQRKRDHAGGYGAADVGDNDGTLKRSSGAERPDGGHRDERRTRYCQAQLTGPVRRAQTIRERLHELVRLPPVRGNRRVRTGIQCPTRAESLHTVGCNTRLPSPGRCKQDSRIFDCLPSCPPRRFISTRPMGREN